MAEKSETKKEPVVSGNEKNAEIKKNEKMAAGKPETTSGGKTTAAAKSENSSGGKTTAAAKSENSSGGKTTAAAKSENSSGGKTTATAKPTKSADKKQSAAASQPVLTEEEKAEAKRLAEMEREKQPDIIVLDHVSIRFNLSKEIVDDFKEYVIKLVKRQLKYNEFWALTDISVTVKKGDRLGILGFNGAGKSTLLKVIVGVYRQTSGSVKVYGKIAPMLELGAGFDSNYTGRENVFLYGAVLGYRRKFLEEKYDEIVEFSELGEFMDVPLKNYSSGMKARLGFSIATIVEPEILILDEVLSVGDAKFRRKSEKRIMDMFEKGVTVLFVSHSTEQVMRLCNRAILLDKGRLIAQGDVEEVAGLYNKMTES